MVLHQHAADDGTAHIVELKLDLSSLDLNTMWLGMAR
jgi:hypothetical protein